MGFYSFNDIQPVVAVDSYVHPSAEVIGDVIIAAKCYIGPNAVLRGDMGTITIAEGSNVQDNCVIHTHPQQNCTLQRHSHIGHGAVLHGCEIGENCLIGIGAIILDMAKIGDHSIVGAGAIVLSKKEYCERSLIVGQPAKCLRQLQDSEINWKNKGTEVYKQLVEKSLKSCKRIDQPLSEIDANRRTNNWCQHAFKFKK